MTDPAVRQLLANLAAALKSPQGGAWQAAVASAGGGACQDASGLLEALAAAPEALLGMLGDADALQALRDLEQKGAGFDDDAD